VADYWIEYVHKPYEEAPDQDAWVGAISTYDHEEVVLVFSFEKSELQHRVNTVLDALNGTNIRSGPSAPISPEDAWDRAMKGL